MPSDMVSLGQFATAEYTYARQDLIALLRAQRQVSRGPGFMLPAVMAALIIGGTLSYQLYKPAIEGRLFHVLLNSPESLWIIILVVGGAFHLSTWVASFPIYSNLPMAGKRLRYDLANDGLHVSDGTSAKPKRLQWQGFTDAVVRQDAIVLFLSKTEGIVLPRRAFAEGQFEAAREFIAARTTKKRAGSTSKS